MPATDEWAFYETEDDSNPALTEGEGGEECGGPTVDRLKMMETGSDGEGKKRKPAAKEVAPRGKNPPTKKARGSADGTPSAAKAIGAGSGGAPSAAKAIAAGPDLSELRGANGGPPGILDIFAWVKGRSPSLFEPLTTEGGEAVYRVYDVVRAAFPETVNIRDVYSNVIRGPWKKFKEGEDVKKVSIGGTLTRPQI